LLTHTNDPFHVMTSAETRDLFLLSFAARVGYERVQLPLLAAEGDQCNNKQVCSDSVAAWL
jgi:hypothetical protein